ncbi:MAG: FtsX-like permease family protein [Sulfurovum sp.]|nr:MAG: FtsX-like permease family protein [Sulfurovum sp.]
MISSSFLNFLYLTLQTNRTRHLSIFIIGSLIVFILSSSLFIVSSLKYESKKVVEAMSDFTITKLNHRGYLHTSQIDELSQKYGLSAISSRVQERYFTTPQGYSFLIIGVDFFEEQGSKEFSDISKRGDFKKFLMGENMLIGQGVNDYLSKNHYDKYFNFKTPSGALKKINIFDTLAQNSSIVSNDMVIIPLSLAQEIFGMQEDELSSIGFNVPNDAEWDNVKLELYESFYDIDVVSKKEIQNMYDEIFNFKSGLFIMLFMILLFTYMVLLYTKYSSILSNEKREIGILRAIGWSINDVLKLKFSEMSFVVISSYLIGVLSAYIFVYIFNAPLLSSLFLGSSNLNLSIIFTPIIDMLSLMMIFLLFVVPFLVAVIIPTWRVASTNPKEALS